MKKSALLSILALGLASGFPSTANAEVEEWERQNEENRKQRIQQGRLQPHKGQKRYSFSIDGGFTSDSGKLFDEVFHCFAINDKNAVKKFNQWYNNQKK